MGWLTFGLASWRSLSILSLARGTYYLGAEMQLGGKAPLTLSPKGEGETDKAFRALPKSTIK